MIFLFYYWHKIFLNKHSQNLNLLHNFIFKFLSTKNNDYLLIIHDSKPINNKDSFFLLFAIDF